MPEDPAPNPSAIPAHALYVALATSILTQKLHYRSGDEETAARNISKLFDTVRALMTDHQGAVTFHHFALIMLNEVLRPCTARWHGWMVQDRDKVDKDGKPVLKFRDEWVRRKFREELRGLQPRMIGFQLGFEQLSKTGKFGKKWGGAKLDRKVLNELTRRCWSAGNEAELGGEDLPMRIRPQVILRGVDENGRLGDDDQSKLPENQRINGDSIAKAEACEIQLRRTALGRSDGQEQLCNVTGLALSGGGIRSATFCLGVVQALQQRRMFHHFDYLSTVSGGGYLGAFLSSLLGVDSGHLENAEKNIEAQLGRGDPAVCGPPPSGAPLPDDPQSRLDAVFKRLPDEAEPGALRHLRNNCRYLLNGGASGLLSIVGVFLTGVGSSLLILLSLPAVLSLILGLLHSLHLPAVLQCWFWLTTALLAALWMLLPLARRFAQGTKWDSKPSNRARDIGAAILAGALLAAVLGILGYAPGWVESYDGARAKIVENWPLFTGWAISDKVLAVLFGAVPAVAGVLMRGGKGGPRPLAKWLFAITGPLFFLFTFLVSASALGVGGNPDRSLWWALPLSFLVLLWIWAFLDVNAFALHSYYRDRLCECYLAMQGRRQRTRLKRRIDHLLHGVPDTGEIEKVDGIGTLQRVPLSALGHNKAAPYHLINATLNAAASRNPTLRGRKGDFFLFSKCFCGSPLTGYIRTQDMEKADPHADLGTAMAISGAAASTNMGWQTMTQYRFLLTLFNIRLGYWLPRPGSQRLDWLRRPGERALQWLRQPGRRIPDWLRRSGKQTFDWLRRPENKHLQRLLEGPGPLYFFRELFGGVHERTGYVNLSDGGHIENLGVYELLRRQCKFIVCVDAGMEPGMECADLMRLQRYATIDLGIRMHFDPADLTLLPTSFSRAYAVLVKIDYEPPQPPEPGRDACDPHATSGSLGWMLYLKLAVTGTEPRYVLDYRRQNPQFPHQTTGDQFYDEAQFEAYRALGEAAVESLFRREVIGDGTPKDLAGWFQSLADSFLPDNDPAIERKSQVESQHLEG